MKTNDFMKWRWTIVSAMWELEKQMQFYYKSHDTHGSFSVEKMKEKQKCSTNQRVQRKRLFFERQSNEMKWKEMNFNIQIIHFYKKSKNMCKIMCGKKNSIENTMHVNNI